MDKAEKIQSVGYAVVSSLGFMAYQLFVCYLVPNLPSRLGL